MVRLGSVRAAARELGMTDSGVSMHIAQLRKELDDPLYCRRPSGLAFTPGGLRLASRAVEILGLQQQTALEVSQAGNGRRLLRDRGVPAVRRTRRPRADRPVCRAREGSVGRAERPPRPSVRESDLSRAVDVALGPRVLVRAAAAVPAPVPAVRGAHGVRTPAPDGADPAVAAGNCASSSGSSTVRGRRRRRDAAHAPRTRHPPRAATDLPERRRRGGGGPAVVGADAGTRLRDRRRTVGRLSRPRRRSGTARGRRMVRHDPAPPHLQPAATELLHFVSTPRCIQAMIRGNRRRRHPLQTQGARHTLELTPDARITRISRYALAAPP